MGQRKIVVYKAYNFIYGQQRAKQGIVSLLGSQTRFIGILSDDFATVDFREELCYSKPSEKAKFGELF